jgi:hypothetical protein
VVTHEHEFDRSRFERPLSEQFKAFALRNISEGPYSRTWVDTHSVYFIGAAAAFNTIVTIIDSNASFEERMAKLSKVRDEIAQTITQRQLASSL